MLEVIEIITLLTTIVLSIFSIKNINTSSIYLFHLLFVFLTVTPLFLDYIVGYPIYSSTYPGFQVACSDPLVRILYSIFLILTQFLVFAYSIKNKLFSFRGVREYVDINATKSNVMHNIRFRRLLLMTSIISPILAIIFRMPIQYLLSWSWRYEGFDTSSITGYGTLERLSYIGIVAAAIIFVKEKNVHIKVLAAISLYMNICIEGKRSALFFGLFVFIIVYQILETNRSKRWLVYLLSVIAIAFVINISIDVQMTYRDYTDFDELYRMLRVDLFRDDTIKFSIYCMLYPDREKILDYPFQSLIMQIGFFFPLVWIGIPKVGYETYMTAALKFRSIDLLANSVRMTVSIYDCLFANFGPFAFVLGALFIIIFANYTDKAMYDIKPIWISGFILYSMYSLSYICWFFEFWIVALWLFRHVRIKRKVV